MELNHTTGKKGDLMLRISDRLTFPSQKDRVSESGLREKQGVIGTDVKNTNISLSAHKCFLFTVSQPLCRWVTCKNADRQIKNVFFLEDDSVLTLHWHDGLGKYRQHAQALSLLIRDVNHLLSYQVAESETPLNTSPSLILPLDRCESGNKLIASYLH